VGRRYLPRQIDRPTPRKHQHTIELFARTEVLICIVGTNATFAWAEKVGERGRAGEACPPPIPLGAIHVIGPSSKMLNQPPVSPLTWPLKIIKIVATICQILRLKCTKSFVSWGFTPDPAYIVYILYTYIFCIFLYICILYIFILHPCPPLLLQNRSSAHGPLFSAVGSDRTPRPV